MQSRSTSAGRYQVPGINNSSGMVVSSTEIGIIWYQILPRGHVNWKHMYMYLWITSKSVTSECLAFQSWKTHFQDVLDLC